MAAAATAADEEVLEPLSGEELRRDWCIVGLCGSDDDDGDEDEGTAVKEARHEVDRCAAAFQRIDATVNTRVKPHVAPSPAAVEAAHAMPEPEYVPAVYAILGEARVRVFARELGLRRMAALDRIRALIASHTADDAERLETYMRDAEQTMMLFADFDDPDAAQLLCAARWLEVFREELREVFFLFMRRTAETMEGSAHDTAQAQALLAAHASPLYATYLREWLASNQRRYLPETLHELRDCMNDSLYENWADVRGTHDDDAALVFRPQARAKRAMPSRAAFFGGYEDMLVAALVERAQRVHELPLELFGADDARPPPTPESWHAVLVLRAHWAARRLEAHHRVARLLLLLRRRRGAKRPCPEYTRSVEARARLRPTEKAAVGGAVAQARMRLRARRTPLRFVWLRDGAPYAQHDGATASLSDTLQLDAQQAGRYTVRVYANDAAEDEEPLATSDAVTVRVFARCVRDGQVYEPSLHQEQCEWLEREPDAARRAQLQALARQRFAVHPFEREAAACTAAASCEWLQYDPMQDDCVCDAATHEPLRAAAPLLELGRLTDEQLAGRYFGYEALLRHAQRGLQRAAREAHGNAAELAHVHRVAALLHQHGGHPYAFVVHMLNGDNEAMRDAAQLLRRAMGQVHARFADLLLERLQRFVAAVRARNYADLALPRGGDNNECAEQQAQQHIDRMSPAAIVRALEPFRRRGGGPDAARAEMGERMFVNTDALARLRGRVRAFELERATTTTPPGCGHMWRGTHHSTSVQPLVWRLTYTEETTAVTLHRGSVRSNAGDYDLDDLQEVLEQCVARYNAAPGDHTRAALEAVLHVFNMICAFAPSQQRYVDASPARETLSRFRDAHNVSALWLLMQSEK